MDKTVIALYLFLQCYFGNGALEQVLPEKLIHNEILKSYNKDVRPEPSHDKPLIVYFDCRLTKLVTMDVKNQIFVINVFILMKWQDPSLAWNVTKFSGIKNIIMGTNLIWTPDIMLYNSAHEESFSHMDIYKTKALVSYNGTVIWTAPVTWRVSCSFDVTWFPVDMQKCNLTFGSWTYMGTQLHLKSWGTMGKTLAHEKFLVKSGEWELKEFHSFHREVKYVCCPEPFSTIIYNVHLTRMSLYYFLYIILPLLSQVCLFLMVFHIPHDTGERMGFGVTILLSITVFLLVISEKLPEKSDDKPMLGLCFIAEFYLLSAALIAAGININLAKKNSRPPRMLISFANACNGCVRYCPKLRKPGAPEEIPMRKPNGHVNNNAVTTRNNPTLDDAPPPSLHHNAEYAPDEINSYEWINISKAMDKFFFYFFVLATIFIPLFIVSSLDHSHYGG